MIVPAYYSTNSTYTLLYLITFTSIISLSWIIISRNS